MKVYKGPKSKEFWENSHECVAEVSAQAKLKESPDISIRYQF